MVLYPENESITKTSFIGFSKEPSASDFAIPMCCKNQVNKKSRQQNRSLPAMAGKFLRPNAKAEQVKKIRRGNSFNSRLSKLRKL